MTGTFQYTGIMGPRILGKNFNYFQRVSVNVGDFNNEADLIIPFPTSTGGVIFATSGTGTNTVEYSLNGFSIDGELIPGGTRTELHFYHRTISKIWFRVKAGSTGPIGVSVEAWQS